MNPAPAAIDFRANSQQVPPSMPGAVQKATAKFLGNRAALVDLLGNDLWCGKPISARLISSMPFLTVQD